MRQGHLPWSQPMFRTDVTLNVTLAKEDPDQE
jgi:hypothetical protein